MKTIRQQCVVGRDGNPESYPHHPHPHSTKHGRIVWCRGWFPLLSTDRGGIQFSGPGGTRSFRGVE